MTKWYDYHEISVKIETFCGRHTGRPYEQIWLFVQ